ncbi:DUF692 domain-containing protein [soil metagenome]
MNVTTSSQKLPYLGYGIGLRAKHYQDILNTKPSIDWFEIISEDYLIAGGKPLDFLYRIRANYPMVMHGVSLSIGSSDELDLNYLKKLKTLAEQLEPAWISDHLCWTGLNGINMHDLLPLPHTEEAIQHIVDRIKAVQDYLGRQILLENVSSYVTYKDSTIPEWEFLTHIVERADCFILLDINNIYVNSYNHGFEPQKYINAIPKNRVVQFHLAGHENAGEHIIDTHDDKIIDPVWDLYAYAIQHFGQVSTLIERDDKIPSLTELLGELKQAREIGSHAQQVS